MDNNTFGAQFNSNNSQTPSNDQNNQFAPPPNNIFIRTMNSDMETLKDNGGSLPSFESPNANFSQTPSQATNIPTSNVNNSVTEAPNNPFANQSMTPPPMTPTFNNQVDGIPSSNVPDLPKKKKSPVLLLILLGILLLGGGGFAAYKFVWPKFVQPKTPVVAVNNFKCGCDLQNQPICTATGTGASCSNAGDCTCTQVPTTTVVTLPPTPFIEIPSSANTPIAISPISLDFTNKNLAAMVLFLIKTEVNKATPVNTLKPVRVDYKGQYLSTKEMLAVLFKGLPPEITNFVTDKYTVYAYYGNLGPSLGFIVETNSPDSIKTAMTNWEKKGMLDGAANLFLKAVTKPSTIAFKDRPLPIGGTARYIAYKTKNTELNYIIYNNYLIITTGKDNLEAVIGNLANH
ncbi:MAG TPA: hypothetical protein PLX10_00395 [Candidatus Paceibacterota bacterium]|nr:hypothetical protein [Candidatus Paceibacterota bacterium]